MDISSITETLNKIDTESAKIKYLEKCLLEEKSQTTKSKIIDLLKKLKKDKLSFENYLKQLVKEKKIQLIKELIKQSPGFRPPKEERKRQNTQLEAVIESELERNKLIEALSPSAAVPPRNAETQVYVPRNERSTKDESYTLKTADKGYRSKEQIEPSSYAPRIESQEEYKKKEPFKVGIEDEQKKEEYKRKVLRGMI